MAHMKGVEPAEAGWLTRLIYWFVRRGIRKVTGRSRLIEPVKIAAHHPRLLRAIGKMEGGVEAAHSVPAPLKRLARTPGGDARRLPVLNRHQLCREQRGGGQRSAVGGPGRL